MNQLTSSRLNILKNCQAMQWLPWVEESSKGGQRGTRIHEGIVKRIAYEPTMLDYEEEQCVTSAVAWLRDQDFDQVSTECAYSLLPDGTVRRILNTEHRDYGLLTPGEVPGTLDVVARKGSKHFVIDWKSGQEAEAPDSNWQMLFGGAAVSRMYDLTEVELVLAYVRPDHVYAVRETVSVLALHAFRSALSRALLAKDGPTTGSHCHYCPAVTACPAQAKAITTLAPGPKWTVEYVSELNDSMMVEHLPGLKAAIERVEDALKERAKSSGGIMMSDGKVWKQKVRVMPRFSRATAESFLTPEQAAQCVEKREELYFTKVRP